MHHNEVKKRTQTPDMDKQHKGESYDFFFSKEEVLVSQEKKIQGWRVSVLHTYIFKLKSKEHTVPLFYKGIFQVCFLCGEWVTPKKCNCAHNMSFYLLLLHQANKAKITGN